MLLPTAETILPAEFPHFLQHLESLLNNLPDAIPIGDKYSAFLTFVLDPELVEKTGHEIGALSEQFKRIFGWQARTTSDGILSIEERGLPICSVVKVFQRFHHQYPEDVVLKKWAVDIAIGAGKVYSQHGLLVIKYLFDISNVADAK